LKKEKSNKAYSYETIIQAVHGDVVAINNIVDTYEAYICKLATVKTFDMAGNMYFHVDEELKRTLQTKLITSILKFDPV